MQTTFRDRQEAGRALAAILVRHPPAGDVLVLALPRGGVPVAFEVAAALDRPLDVFVVRKLGVPGHEELAMGAIATGGVTVLNDDVVDTLAIPRAAIERVAEKEKAELARREAEYRDARPAPTIAGRTAVVVDDGLATGSTMRAAVAALRRLGAERVIVAVPLGSSETCAELRAEADAVVCAATPEPFHAVGVWYDDFSQTTDDEVKTLLARAARRHPDRPGPAERPAGSGSF